jgi:KDO2-lipid IV(A) lauroyltransferase
MSASHGVLEEARFRLEAWAFRWLLGLAAVVPRKLLLALGDAAGLVAYGLDHRHRRITIENLNLALGHELGPAGVRRTARRCWRHFGRITLDTLCFRRLGPNDVGGIVRYEGLEHIRGAYESGRGVLLFSGHFGHWELIALMQGFLGLPLALVARPLDNPYLERLLAAVRSRSGNRIIHKRNAMREMIRAIRDRIGVAIMIDQDARERGVFVPFFGRPASTTPALARLALRTGAAVVPTYSIPLPDRSYRVVYEPPIDVRQSGDTEADVLRLTATCSARLEAWVRSHPELWLWMHRRWKTSGPAGRADDGQAG